MIIIESRHRCATFSPPPLVLSSVAHTTALDFHSHAESAPFVLPVSPKQEYCKLTTLYTEISLSWVQKFRHMPTLITYILSMQLNAPKHLLGCRNTFKCMHNPPHTLLLLLCLFSLPRSLSLMLYYQIKYTRSTWAATTTTRGSLGLGLGSGGRGSTLPTAPACPNRTASCGRWPSPTWGGKRGSPLRLTSTTGGA